MDTFKDDPLVQAVTAYVKEYMSNYDASHDWSHIERVVGLSHYIYFKSANKELLDLRTIHLAALLHDVGDKKYLKSSEDPTTLIFSLLTSLSCPSDLASKIQLICLNVSYSTETKNPANPGFIMGLIKEHPELAVVQDADRLDAVGAVGLGRMFTFGGAKTGRDMDGSMEHVDEKLVRLVDLAKTEVGRELMRERTERLRVFQGWWAEEVGFAKGFERKGGPRMKF